MKAAVLGCGSWGTALASLISSKGYSVGLWARRNDLARDVQSCHENRRYLPDVILPEIVHVTDDVQKACAQADVVVVAVPSDACREVVKIAAAYIEKEALIIHAGKGLERSTGLRGSEVIAEVCGPDVCKRTVVMSGPNLALELATGVPTATVVAGESEETARLAQTFLSSKSLRVYRNVDLKGVELGGALKNVYALGCGIIDGIGFGDNTKATLVTRGLAEMTRMGAALGADEKTFRGLSGIGDLMATSASTLSRNLRLGAMLGRGISMSDAMHELGQVAEGVDSCKAAYALSRDKDIYMPICREVHEVLFNEKSPMRAVSDLMDGAAKDEME